MLGNHDFEYGNEYFSKRAYEEYRPRVTEVSGSENGAHLFDVAGIHIFAADDANNQFTKDELNEFKKVCEDGRPVLFVSHVPFEPDMGDTTLLEKSIELFGTDGDGNSRALIGEHSVTPNETTKEMMDIILADDSPVFCVLAGHVHYPHEDLLNENVTQMLTIKSVGGVVVGDCIQKTLAYHGFKYIDAGVQTSWDFGSCQDRPRAFILAHREKPWKLPTPTGEHVTLEDMIGDLPSLEIGEYDPLHKGHDARYFTWSKPQIEVMRHTPTGSSAKHNPDPWKPCKVDGSPSQAQFDCAYGRKSWLKTGTILQDSKSISGFRNCHPGRLLPDGTYSDARPLTLLEVVRCFSLPDSFLDEVSAWATENFLRKALGEAVVPAHYLAIFKQIYP